MRRTLPPSLEKILKTLYGLPASVVIISGYWKTGKTDFSLSVREWIDELDLVHNFASNVETQDPAIEFINDFQNWDYWTLKNRSPKLYIYDESIESSPRRGAMSRVNVGWVKRIPQLSKGRVHLLVLTQEENLTDSVFFNPAFLRGHFRKLSKTVVEFSSKYYVGGKPFVFRDVPRTSVSFDPYLGAAFHLEGENLRFPNLPRPLKVSSLYGEGKSFLQIQKELGINNPNSVKQDLRLICNLVKRIYLERPQEVEKISEEIRKESELTPVPD